MKAWVFGVMSLAAATAFVPAAQAALPPLVNAYVEQLVRQCGGQGVNPGLIDQFDINGDKLDDFIVDASRQPCPTRPEAYRAAGSTVTVFLARPDGLAYPALQRNALSAQLERKPGGGYSLWLNLAGEDCGSAESARCTRQVLWTASDQRLDLAPAEGPAPR